MGKVHPETMFIVETALNTSTRPPTLPTPPHICVSRIGNHGGGDTTPNYRS